MERESTCHLGKRLSGPRTGSDATRLQDPIPCLCMQLIYGPAFRRVAIRCTGAAGLTGMTYESMTGSGWPAGTVSV